MRNKGLSLSMSMSLSTSASYLSALRRRPTRSLRQRLTGWLASKSRARLAGAERALLDDCEPADGEVLVLDGLSGLAAGRLAQLAAIRDDSLDAVVSVAALADAPDVTTLLSEIKRALRPGGRLLFVEPVAAPAGTRLRRLQRSFDLVWRLLAGSPRAPRDLWNDLKAAAFGALTYHQVSVRGLAGVPVPHLVGEALRTGAGTIHQLRGPIRPGRRTGEPGRTQPAFAFFG
jgi:SAM-dependent methyltransferase